MEDFNSREDRGSNNLHLLLKARRPLGVGSRGSQKWAESRHRICCGGSEQQLALSLSLVLAGFFRERFSFLHLSCLQRQASENWSWPRLV